MKKGDETRKEILRVSEELFCTRGYDETSIQNILDVIHGSKGGFYHHFVSKEDVLRTICMRRAAASAEQTVRAVETAADPLSRLNTVLCRMMPLHRHDWDFMSMLLPILDRTESVAVRVGYQDALTDAFLPMLRRETEACMGADLIRPVTERPEKPVLTLLNACWAELIQLLLQDMKTRDRTETGVLLEILSGYRRCVEALLDAPFGSIELMQLEDWQSFAAEMHRTVRTQNHA